MPGIALRMLVMNGRRILVLIASIILAIVASACGNKNVEESNKAGEEKRRAYATEEADNILSVDAFGLTVKKPDGWYAASFEELNGIVNTATHVLTVDRAELKNTIKSADKNLYNLFSISQFGPEKVSTDNHNIGALAERVSHVPHIKTGKDYWEEAKKLFAQANAKYDIEDEYTTRVIGCLLYTSPSPRDRTRSRMPSSA